MNIMAQARKLAKEQFLRGVSFFDKDGNIGARGNAVHHVELEFSNNDKITMTLQEFGCIKDVVFRLGDAEDNK